MDLSNDTLKAIANASTAAMFDKEDGNLTEGNVKVLEEIRRVMLTVPAEKFDLGIWGKYTGSYTSNSEPNYCGTVACVAGHLSFDPWFNQNGVTHKWHGYALSLTINLDLPEWMLEELFYPSVCYDAVLGVEDSVDEVKPEHVVQLIDAWLTLFTLSRLVACGGSSAPTQSPPPPTTPPPNTTAATVEVLGTPVLQGIGGSSSFQFFVDARVQNVGTTVIDNPTLRVTSVPIGIDDVRDLTQVLFKGVTCCVTQHQLNPGDIAISFASVPYVSSTITAGVVYWVRVSVYSHDGKELAFTSFFIKAG